MERRAGVLNQIAKPFRAGEDFGADHAEQSAPGSQSQRRDGERHRQGQRDRPIDLSLARTIGPPDSGQIFVNGQPVTIGNPRDAKALGIETIYQTLALADNLDAPANVFLGREVTSAATLNDAAMESATRKVIGRLNPNFKNFKTPVLRLSGGQRQAVAIARAIHFNARALIMDEPTAALGPAETAQVHALIRQLKSEGIGIFLVSHDIHDVFDLSERISVMYHGKLVGTVNKNDVTTDEVLGMIILGKPPTKLTQQELAELHG